MPNNVNVDNNNVILKEIEDKSSTKKKPRITFVPPTLDEVEAYLDKASLVPTVITINDEALIVNARTAYNLLEKEELEMLKQNYDQDYLDNLYNNLVNAEEKWLELKLTRINKIYGYLIEDIKNLGAHYQFDKLADYYEISKVLDRMDRNDKKYIDDSNVESFKDEFDSYFI